MIRCPPESAEKRRDSGYVFTVENRIQIRRVVGFGRSFSEAIAEARNFRSWQVRSFDLPCNQLSEQFVAACRQMHSVLDLTVRNIPDNAFFLVIGDFLPQQVLMKIDQQNDDLRVLLGSMGVESAAFITAWNPRSEQLSDDENDDRQAILLTDIETMRLNYLVGYGQLDDWQEYSYFVLGIDKDQATAMATRYEQNAYVWIGPAGIPELITTV